MGQSSVESGEKGLGGRIFDLFQDEEFHAFLKLRAGDAGRKGEGLWAAVDFGGNGGRMHKGRCNSGDQGSGPRDQVPLLRYWDGLIVAGGDSSVGSFWEFAGGTLA